MNEYVGADGDGDRIVEILEAIHLPEAPLGLDIKGLRQDKGMTQSQLADGVGVQSLAVAKWESDDSRLSKKTRPDYEPSLRCRQSNHR